MGKKNNDGEGGLKRKNKIEKIRTSRIIQFRESQQVREALKGRTNKSKYIRESIIERFKRECQPQKDSSPFGELITIEALAKQGTQTLSIVIEQILDCGHPALEYLEEVFGNIEDIIVICQKPSMVSTLSS
ncbi:MAG: hypothetical protein ACFFBD_22395 [Candidatus Hodarchaeota archaeon]